MVIRNVLNLQLKIIDNFNDLNELKYMYFYNIKKYTFSKDIPNVYNNNQKNRKL